MAFVSDMEKQPFYFVLHTHENFKKEKNEVKSLIHTISFVYYYSIVEFKASVNYKTENISFLGF